MKVLNIQTIGDELAIAWDDGSESYIGMERLRRSCPCAYCAGETDIMGNVARGPEQDLSAASFEMKSLDPVGTYAYRITWADGHNSGIYSYEHLRKLGCEPA